MAFLDDLQGWMTNAAQKFGVSKSYLATTAKLESGLNPNADGGGLYQFRGPAMQDVGLSNPYDAEQSVFGAASYGANNTAYLSNALNRPPKDWEVYLAHQQGAGGAARILTNPGEYAEQGVSNFKGNVNASEFKKITGLDINNPFRPITNSDFASYWKQKYQQTSGVTASAFNIPAFGGGSSELTMAQAAADLSKSLNPSAFPDTAPGGDTSTWRSWIEHQAVRGAVVVTGFVFLGVGLGMFALGAIFRSDVGRVVAGSAIGGAVAGRMARAPAPGNDVTATTRIDDTGPIGTPTVTLERQPEPARQIEYDKTIDIDPMENAPQLDDLNPAVIVNRMANQTMREADANFEAAKIRSDQKMFKLGNQSASTETRAKRRKEIIDSGKTMGLSATAIQKQLQEVGLHDTQRIKHKSALTGSSSTPEFIAKIEAEAEAKKNDIAEALAGKPPRVSATSISSPTVYSKPVAPKTSGKKSAKKLGPITQAEIDALNKSMANIGSKRAPTIDTSLKSDDNGSSKKEGDKMRANTEAAAEKKSVTLAELAGKKVGEIVETDATSEKWEIVELYETPYKDAGGKTVTARMAKLRGLDTSNKGDQGFFEVDKLKAWESPWDKGEMREITKTGPTSHSINKLLGALGLPKIKPGLKIIKGGKKPEDK